MPYPPPYYNYCPPGYNNSYSQSVVPSYPQQQYQQPTYYNFPIYQQQQQQQYPSYYPKQYAYKVSFTTVDAPNGDDFSASASNTILKFLDGSNITITGKTSDYSVTVGLNEDVTLTGGSLTLSDTSDLVTTPVAAQTLITSGTIATTSACVKVLSGGVVTGIILSSTGAVDGQHLTIINEGVAGNTLAFNAATSTSNVAGNAALVMVPDKAYKFVYNSSATGTATVAAWYPVDEMN